MPDCPTCGHNTSAFAGACSAIVAEPDGSFGYCRHDCSVDILGESVHDRLVRALWGDQDDDGSNATPPPSDSPNGEDPSC